jgi:hypothetical protein
MNANINTYIPCPQLRVRDDQHMPAKAQRAPTNFSKLLTNK